MQRIEDTRGSTSLAEHSCSRAEPVAAPRGETQDGRSLLDVLGDTIERHGDRIAIDAADAVLTYAQLSDAADLLADRLREAGVGPGDRIGIKLASGRSSLYVAILGVLRAGGAYVPVDADDPAGRAEGIWESAEVCGVIEDELSFTARRAPVGAARDLSAEDDAWIIFTSGSTGRPKGVAVSHRAAVAFVDAEARLWEVLPEDRVLAGLSVSFDASCEEMWLAWANGATLVPAPRALMRTGVDLGPWLAERGVTVISTVPTLAAMWDDELLAGVRLLILGGEACPPELAWRLARGREVWNTYGPTEATVVSTAARVRDGAPVTIGWPLAGWEVAVVDEAGEPVALGETGELIVGGAGLGRYLDPQLDRERFAPLSSLGWERAYRSGDLVRETAHGLDFVGRRDHQVKLAGRRLELGEVEAQLRAVRGVRAAAVVVQSTAAANKILVGYVVGDVNPEHVRAQVAEQLPDGLAPLVVVLESLPMATSGKVDRAALPWPLAGTADAGERDTLTGTAAWLAERWAEQLGPMAFGAESDFFELGATSVATAKLVSLLRARFPSVAVADVYEHRRLGAQAARLEELGEGRREETSARRAVGARGGRALQLAGVFVLLFATIPAWLEGLFAYNDVFGGGTQLAWPALIAGYLLLVAAPGRAAIVAATRRLLLGDLQAGRYPRHSWMGCRVWFVDRLAEVLHVNRVGGTPWAGRLARMLGAEVGPGARLGTLPSPASLIRIGAGATIEADVDMHGWWVEGSELVVGRLEIGPGARVGTRAVLMPGAEIGAGAEVEPGSVVATRVPAGERWAGTPARRVGDAGETWPLEAPPRERRPRLWNAMFGFGLLGLNALAIVAVLPGLLLFETAFNPFSSSSILGTVRVLLVGAPLLAATFVLGEALLSALVFRLVSRMVKPGWHGDGGSVAWASWFGEQVMESARSALFPLYATVCTRWWLRLHGLRVGRRTEVSTAQGLNRLVTMGETTFVADAPMFATARAHHGWMQLEPIAVGSGTFVGNGALLTGGTTVGDGSLIGIESIAPPNAPDGTSWFGGPAIELPRVPDRTDPARTTDPPLRLVLARAATELVRVLLPGTVSILLGTLVFLALDAIGSAAGALALIAAAPFAVLAAAVCAVLFTIVLKWLIMGRYRPGEHPLWSSFVWRDEIMNSCQEQLAGDWLMNKAQGTALMPVYLRAMGAQIGRDVWCETLAITEFDVVKVGDGCAINRGACLETHLFHDRLMRIGPNDLGAGATLGPHSATLPDTKLGPGCVVGGRSVVLRGEELPANTRWHGVPVEGM
jgi:non-ribosomal peptide synthetase-like protein